jgi:hypothetical protein
MGGMMDYTDDPRFLAAGFVHEAMIRYDELDRYDEQFSAAVRKRFPGVMFTLEMRPHDNPRLHAAGDRIRVALKAHLDG